MKKFIARLFAMLIGMVGITVANNVVMLKIHPLEFYYTPTGLMISAIVMGIEMLILYPIIGWQFNKLIAEYYEWLNKEES